MGTWLTVESAGGLRERFSVGFWSVIRKESDQPPATPRSPQIKMTLSRKSTDVLKSLVPQKACVYSDVSRFVCLDVVFFKKET